MLEQLDNKSLANSRVVAISWREFVDDREYPWKRFIKVIADMNEECFNGRNPFHLACEKGQVGIANTIMRNSDRKLETSFQGHMDYLEGNYARSRAVGGARPKVATVIVE